MTKDERNIILDGEATYVTFWIYSTAGRSCE